jgi:hypothetical protein
VSRRRRKKPHGVCGEQPKQTNIKKKEEDEKKSLSGTQLHKCFIVVSGKTKKR